MTCKFLPGCCWQPPGVQPIPDEEQISVPSTCLTLYTMQWKTTLLKKHSPLSLFPFCRATSTFRFVFRNYRPFVVILGKMGSTLTLAELYSVSSLSVPIMSFLRAASLGCIQCSSLQEEGKHLLPEGNFLHVSVLLVYSFWPWIEENLEKKNPTQ